MTQILRVRFPEFGSEYNPEELNQFAKTLKEILGERDYVQQVTRVVNSASETIRGTDTIVPVDYTDTGAASLNLPLASLVRGRYFVIIDSGGNASGNNITVNASGSDQINGASSLVIATDSSATVLYSDGRNYYTQQ